jgi:hypothetical protein
MRLRRSFVCFASAVSIVATAGCGLGSSTTSPSPQSIAAHLGRAFGLQLRPVAPGTSAALENVQATYAGGDERHSLTLVVFDSSLAARQLTGGRSSVATPGLLVSRGPMVVIYRSEISPGPAVARAIESALSGAGSAVRG